MLWAFFAIIEKFLVVGCFTKIDLSLCKKNHKWDSTFIECKDHSENVMEWKGGVDLSNGNQSYLRFSLEESVWFQRGQEVEELISISLDPNITINESDQYVTIKGSLELYGEYNRDENEPEEEPFYSTPKFIQTVEVREEGVCYFTHYFPVEITIPKNRIEEIENIDVAVETFDYAFPERSCLRLSADLMITGLYGEQQHEILQEQEDDFIEEEPDYELLYRDEVSQESLEIQEIEDEISDENSEEISIDEYISGVRSPFSKPVFEEDEDPDNELYEPFEVEARREAKADETLKSLTEEIDRDDYQQITFLEQNKEKQPQIEDSNDFSASEQEEKRISESNENSPQEKEEEETTDTLHDIFFAAKRNEQAVTGIQAGKEETKESAPVNEQEEESPEEEFQEEETSPEAMGKKKKWKKKQSLSITEFLARKEEESHTRLKVCIVQKGDTIDELSDRYDVSIAQLQRVNNLEINQDVYEGQVLYIPVAQKQK